MQTPGITEILFRNLNRKGTGDKAQGQGIEDRGRNRGQGLGKGDRRNGKETGDSSGDIRKKIAVSVRKQTIDGQTIGDRRYLDLNRGQEISRFK